MNDAQLLQSFAERHSETAFRTLVERHLPLVFGTARRITRDNGLAEDIAQTVFILLARKANSLSAKTILSGWLYRSTKFVAARALTAEQRRRQREQEAVIMQESSSSNVPRLHLSSRLDDALARLGETDRNAILLRYFEGQSLREVGLALDLNEEAAKKRVSRALEKLRRMLSRRGTQVSAAALVAGLAAESADAASALPLAGKISAVTLAHITAGSGATAGSALLKESLAGLWRAKVFNAAKAAVGLVGVAVLLTITTRHWQRLTASPVATPLLIFTNATASKNPPKSRANNSGNSASYRKLLVTVLDAETRRPIPQAVIAPYVNGVSVPDFQQPFRTGSDGTVRIPIPKNVPDDDRGDYSEFPVNAPGYATRVMRWFSSTGMVLNIISAQHTVYLSHGVTLSGTITDDGGNPLAGYHVGAIGNNAPGETTTDTWTPDGKMVRTPTAQQHDYSSFFLNLEESSVVTDANGRFKLEDYPSDAWGLAIQVRGPDGDRHEFGTGEGYLIHAEHAPKISFAELKEGSARLIIPPGTTVQGVVVDAGGKPIAGAKITEAAQWGNLRVLSENQTDSAGRFHLSNRPTHQIILGVAAEGCASISAIVNIQPGMAPVRLQLPPALPLRGRVVNEAGLPIADADVSTDDVLNRGQCLNWSVKTDANGQFYWEQAPNNEIAFYVTASGYALHIARLRAATNEEIITLSPENIESVHVTGRMTDADSGDPVPDFHLRISHRARYDGIPIEPPTQEFEGSNGEINVKLLRGDFPVGSMGGWVMSVEADGYDPAMSRAYYFGEGDQQLDFKLHPGGAVKGTIYTPDGAPAADAQLAFDAEEGFAVLSLQPGRIPLRKPTYTSDTNGWFQAPKPPLAKSVVVFHGTGWAIIPVTAGSAKTEVHLKPWGCIEGTVKAGDEPAAGRKIKLEDLARDNSSAVSIIYSASTDTNGIFIFDKVPAGIFKLSCDATEAGKWNLSTMQTSVKVAAGETNFVAMSAAGATVVAQLSGLPGCGTIIWSNAMAVLRSDVDLPPEPDRQNFVTDEAFETAREQYFQDPTVIAATGSEKTFAGTIGADGSVVFEQIPAGNYILEVKLFDPSAAPIPPNRDNDPAFVVSHLRTEVIVPKTIDTSENSTPIQLGSYSLKSL